MYNSYRQCICTGYFGRSKKPLNRFALLAGQAVANAGLPKRIQIHVKIHQTLRTESAAAATTLAVFRVLQDGDLIVGEQSLSFAWPIEGAVAVCVIAKLLSRMVFNRVILLRMLWNRRARVGV